MCVLVNIVAGLRVLYGYYIYNLWTRNLASQAMRLFYLWFLPCDSSYLFSCSESEEV